MAAAIQRILFSRIALWVAVTVVSAYFTLFINHYVNFGIDLVGGTYITLKVHLDKAQENELAEGIQKVLSIIKTANIASPLSQRIESLEGIVRFQNEDDASQALSLLNDGLKGFVLSKQGSEIILRLSSELAASVNSDAIQSNIDALNNRVNQFGIGETFVAAQGEDRIIVELPNVHNPEQAKALVGKAALLEIKLVDDSAPSKKELLDRYDQDLPEGTSIVPGRREYFLLQNYTDITGKLLKTARMDFGGQTQTEPVIVFEFKAVGSDRFYNMTRDNIGRRAAIVIDGEVITAPVIQSAISGQGTITGFASAEEAQQVASLLRSGAFLAPVSFEEERHIGPSLGAESINQGLVACFVSLVFLFAFSIFFYKIPGLLAFIVLIYNLIFTLMLLSALGGTLTLPGIAGMILNVGMAIDASILIYERIKEELQAGIMLKKAVETGFSGALAVILDANVTHFIIAIVLYKLGSGPIKGFAVTMIVGIFSTLLTGIVMLKSFFNVLLNDLGINKLKF